MSRQNVTFSDDTKVKSLCEPPSVPAKEFNEEKGRFERPLWNRFPENYNNPNSNVCPPGLYLKSTDGRNCCVPRENMATPQEVLDFVNGVIQSYFQNADSHEGKDAKNNQQHRAVMHYYRHHLLTTHQGLVDNLDFNFNERLAKDNQFVKVEPTQEDITEEDGLWHQRKPDGSPFYTRNPRFPKTIEQLRAEFAVIARTVLRANAKLEMEKRESKGGKTRRKKRKTRRRNTRSSRRIRR